MPMMTKEELETFRNNLSFCAHHNWDCTVDVEQDETGSLVVAMFDDDGFLQGRLRAEPYGQDLYGGDLWRFVVEGAEVKKERCPVGSLVPIWVCSLLQC